MRLIHSLLSFARRRTVQMVLGCYTVGSKLLQQPAVRRERRPRFESDRVVVPPHGEVYAIVVKYAGHGESANLHVLLDALRRAKVNTVLVCNGEVPAEELGALSQRVHRVMVRRNVGRDFGAYRAATLSLLSQGVKPERMLYFKACSTSRAPSWTAWWPSSSSASSMWSAWARTSTSITSALLPCQ